MWKCRAVENDENQNQVSLVFHRPWKSLRDSHIPTTPTTILPFPNQNQKPERSPSYAESPNPRLQAHPSMRKCLDKGASGRGVCPSRPFDGAVAQPERAPGSYPDDARSSRVGSTKLYRWPDLTLAHLAWTALRALLLRCSGVMLAALAGPPFLPPFLPSFEKYSRSSGGTRFFLATS